MLERIDVFGKPLPAFNLGGEDTVHTLTGGIFTFIIILILVTYGGLKFVHLIERHNPLVSEVTEKAFYDSSEKMNLNEEGFRFAFTMEGYLSNEVLNNPTHVKYLTRIIGRKGGEWYEKILSYHKCNETDWEEFAPPSKVHADSWINIRDDPKRGFYCLDWDDEEPLVIYGNENNDDYQRIDIALLPCNYVHAEFGDIGDFVHEDCIANLTAQQEYLGNINIIIYH